MTMMMTMMRMTMTTMTKMMKMIMLWRQKLSESVVIEEDRDDIDKEKS